MNHIANMNPMGGPIGNAAPIPMMNNGNVPMVPQPSGPVGAPQAGTPPRNADRSQLNKYIYDYFIRNGMYECARALLNSDKSVTNAKVEGGKNGNVHGNGVADDAMDTDTKDDMDQKLPDDLPAPDVPNHSASDTSFLYDWFCLFWEMWRAQGKSGSTSVHQYVNHTQAQSRMKQNHQQEMLRQMRGEMGVQQQLQAMRMQQNGAAIAMNMKPGGNLARTAMANNQNNPQMMQMMQAKQGPRDPSELEAMRQRASSPGSENAASPSKRPRLDGPPFNPGQPGMMQNGRTVQGMPGQPGAMQNNPAHNMLMAAGVPTNGLTQSQLQNFANVSQGGQAKSIASYSQNLTQHHGNQMPNKQMPNAGGPQNQGSPGMMPQPPEGINAYYNAPGGMEPGRMGPGPGGAQGGTSNHALQDYQMQLMLLEQQNKKRLLMARQEQDNIGTGPRDGAGGPPNQGGGNAPNGPGAAGANGQFSDSSPQAVRAGASPNPPDQMKRGTPQMNNAGMPSPLPEGGAPSRGSPNPMSFTMPGQMDPNAQQFNMMQMNGMRPPSSHPNQPFNGQMNPQQQQQMMAARQQPGGQQPQPQGQQGQQQSGQQQQGQQPQQQQQQVGAQGNPPGQWPQGAPNGTQMVPQSSQTQIQGTPQPRPMAPPSAPSAAGNRNPSPGPGPQPPTPKVTKKKDPKKETKRQGPQKKTTMNSAATPAAESTGDAEPTPATPITPVNPGPFPKSGAGNANGAPVTNGQPAGAAGATAPAPAAPVAPQHPDPTQGASFGMENPGGMVDFQMEFGNTLSNGGMMEDFDFDSFLHDNDAEASNFDFNTFPGLEGPGEIGATE
jgi:hypothetical protein